MTCETHATLAELGVCVLRERFNAKNISLLQIVELVLKGLLQTLISPLERHGYLCVTQMTVPFMARGSYKKKDCAFYGRLTRHHTTLDSTWVWGL